MIAAIFVPFSLPAYPLMAKAFGSIQTAQMTAVAMAVLFVLSPTIHYLALTGSVAAVWVAIICCRTLMTVTFSTCFAAQSLFIGNSVTPDQLGTANGLALLMSDMIRCVSPALFGAIYAASLSEQTLAFGFPVDYNIAFIVYGIVLLALVFVQACLPLSIDHKKIVD